MINMWSEKRNGRHHVIESEYRVEISKRYGFNMGVGKGKEKGESTQFPKPEKSLGFEKSPCLFPRDAEISPSTPVSEPPAVPPILSKPGTVGASILPDLNFRQLDIKVSGKLGI